LRRTATCCGAWGCADWGFSAQPRTAAQFPPRDLDFLVEFQTKSFDAYMDLKDLLEQWFGRPVDLVLADALKPALRDKVLRETVYAPGL